MLIKVHEYERYKSRLKMAWDVGKMDAQWPAHECKHEIKP